MVPVAVIVALFRASSRDWFELPQEQRLPRRPFSIARMIKWRRDGGQTALEYLGLVLVVVALIGGLVATGIGAGITGGVHRAICSLTGSACPAPGTEVVAGDDGASGGGTGPEGGTDAGGSVTSGGTGTAGGSDGTETGGSTASGADGDPTGGGSTDSGSGGSGDTSGTGGDTGSTGGPDGSTGSGSTGSSSNGGSGDGSSGSNGGSGGGTGTGGSTDSAARYGEAEEGGDDFDPTAGPDADYGDYDGTQGEKKDDDEGCTSGVGAFFSCVGHQTGGFFKGLGADGFWGDVTGTVETVFHPVKAWNGIKDYGKSLGEKWSKDSEGAGDKWSEGDYFGAAWDWTKASGSTGLKVADDMFIGDEFRDMWKNGNEGQAIGTGLWNVGSLFIPGYGEAKLIGKFGKLGKLGKLGRLGEVAQKASEAAAKARKLAEAGDVKGAEKAAKEAREHADEAGKKVKDKGCPVGAGPLGRERPAAGTMSAASLRTPTGPGSLRTGHVTTATVTAVRSSPRVVPTAFRAEGDCQATPEEVEAAKKADKDADDAEKAAKQAKREAERKRLAKMEKPSWYDKLKNPRAATKDRGDGKWKAKNPATYAYPQEMGARYQEQISGVRRGKEYEVPLDELKGKPVEFDGWDSAKQTFIETKWGYRGPRFYDEATGELTSLATKRWVDQATRQLDAARGKPLVWHFADPDVAKAAGKMFRDRGLDIKVIHTPVVP